MSQTQTILAHFDGKFIVPDQPLTLSVGQPLRVAIESVSQPSLPDLPLELEEQELGMVVVRGTRIPLYLVLGALYEGKSSAEILSAYPSIPASAIPPIKRFIEHHEAATRKYYESEKAELDRQYAEGKKAPTLESLRARAAIRVPQA